MFRVNCSAAYLAKIAPSSGGRSSDSGRPDKGGVGPLVMDSFGEHPGQEFFGLPGLLQTARLSEYPCGGQYAGYPGVQMFGAIVEAGVVEAEAGVCKTAKDPFYLAGAGQYAAEAVCVVGVCPEGIEVLHICVVPDSGFGEGFHSGSEVVWLPAFAVVGVNGLFQGHALLEHIVEEADSLAANGTR